MKKRKLFLLFILISLLITGYYYREQIEAKYNELFCEESEATKKIADCKGIWGIDLSHHQAEIDWKAVCKKKPHFIFFKATEGATRQDKMYSTYRKEAKKLGIPIGAYHFFSYLKNGKLQAQNFIKQAKLQSGDLPPVLDVEYRGKMPKASVVTNNILSWLAIVKDEYGITPIIYCDYRYYVQYLKGKLKDDYPLWICDYSEKPAADWTFWQKTDKFRLPGINGTIDYNVFNGDSSELKDLLIR